MNMEQDGLMESIINITEGNKPNEKRKCFFCEKEALFTFGIINNNKILTINNDELFVMQAVGLCDTHAEGFNSLLSGEHDINDLISVMKDTKQRKINLRR